jgi:hypothetical protein
MHREQLHIGHSDRLQVDVTKETKCPSLNKGEKYPIFMKVYAGSSIDMPHTFKCCNIDRAHTYASCIIYRSCTYCICWYNMTSST